MPPTRSSGLIPLSSRGILLGNGAEDGGVSRLEVLRSCSPSVVPIPYRERLAVDGKCLVQGRLISFPGAREAFPPGNVSFPMGNMIEERGMPRGEVIRSRSLELAKRSPQFAPFEEQGTSHKEEGTRRSPFLY